MGDTVGAALDDALRPEETLPNMIGSAVCRMSYQFDVQGATSSYWSYPFFLGPPGLF